MTSLWWEYFPEPEETVASSQAGYLKDTTELLEPTTIRRRYNALLS